MTPQTRLAGAQPPSLLELKLSFPQLWIPTLRLVRVPFVVNYRTRTYLTEPSPLAARRQMAHVSCVKAV